MLVLLHQRESMLRTLGVTMKTGLWIAIITSSLYFFFDNVIPYLHGFRSRLWGSTFFQNKVWVTMHLVGGSLTLLLGPMQVWPYVRKKFVKFHRTSGKLYLFGIALIGISAGRLSLISTCGPCRLSLFLLTLFAVVSSFFAWKAIKAGNIKTHRQMMVRSYVCVLAFVAVRIDDIFSLDFMFGAIENSLLRRVVNEYFFSFVPLIIAEMVMIWWPSVAYTFRNIQRTKSPN